MHCFNLGHDEIFLSYVIHIVHMQAQKSLRCELHYITKFRHELQASQNTS